MQGIALPEVVGRGFGEGEAYFGTGVIGGFEELVAVDDATEGVGGDPVALEDALLDAGAVYFLNVAFFPVKGGQNLVDGFEEGLGSYFTSGSLVAAPGGFSDAISPVVIPPGLDGPPSEAHGLAILVGEGHLTDGFIAGEHRVALGVFECAEHSHFEVIAYAFHVAGETAATTVRGWIGVSCCRVKESGGI